MDEREALAKLLLGVVFCNGEQYPWDSIKEEWRESWRVKADLLIAAGYGLRTQAWEQGRDAAKQYCADRAMAYGSRWYTNRDQRSFMGGKAQGFIEAKNGIAALTPPGQMQRTGATHDD